MADDDGQMRARRLTDDALFWDAHSGFMPDPAADLENLSLWSRAGVDHLSINVGFDLMEWTDTVQTIAAFRRWITLRPDRFVIAGTAAAVRAARAAGRLAISFDIEGMNALDGRLEMVALYHRLGVRQILFAYNRNNAAGGGCHDEDSGLTDFGRDVIDEMNRLGMFVDVSHAGYRTSMEVMDYSTRPVIFSHSNAAAVRRHGRNIRDDQARACARTGGVIGLAGVSLFLADGAPSAQGLADHIDHFVSVVGPRHVGLGLDYGFPVDVAGIDDIVAQNPVFWPEEEGYHGTIDFLPPADVCETVELLIRRGYDDEALRAILGGNFLRVAEQVWR